MNIKEKEVKKVHVNVNIGESRKSRHDAYSEKGRKKDSCKSEYKMEKGRKRKKWKVLMQKRGFA